MTKILADMLRIPLTLHPSLSPLAVNTSGKSLNVQVGDNIPVEIALICAVILLLKLLYGLDGRPRRVYNRESLFNG
jgi:RNA polymerase I-specific transcription initiation factor RRN7